MGIFRRGKKKSKKHGKESEVQRRTEMKSTEKKEKRSTYE